MKLLSVSGGRGAGSVLLYPRIDLDQTRPKDLLDNDPPSINDRPVYEMPEVVLERSGLGWMVYVRHGLLRYGVDGWGKRVYGARRAKRYGAKILEAYCSEILDELST